MSTRVRIALVVALAVLIVLLAASIAVARRRAAMRTLHVVVTVEDLRAERPIALDGCRIRLGVSAASVAVGEPLLLYALVEGEHRVAPRSALGPLTVVAGRRELEKLVESRRRPPLGHERLYVKSLTFDEPGEVDLSLRAPNGVEQARARVSVGDGEAVPTFLRLDGGTLRCRKRAGQPDGIPVSNGARAEVDLDGDVAVDIPAVVLPRPFDQPTLALAVKGDEIVVTASETGPLAASSRHFAARFWVNGSPVVETRRALEECVKELTLETLVVRFHLVLDRPALRARPGDRITVQLLYKGDGLPRLTSRVDLPQATVRDGPNAIRE